MLINYKQKVFFFPKRGSKPGDVFAERAKALRADGDNHGVGVPERLRQRVGDSDAFRQRQIFGFPFRCQEGQPV